MPIPAPRRIKIKSDDNELELVDSTTTKPIIHRYKFVVSKEKGGLITIFPDSDLDKMIENKIIIILIQ